MFRAFKNHQSNYNHGITWNNVFRFTTNNSEHGNQESVPEAKKQANSQIESSIGKVTVLHRAEEDSKYEGEDLVKARTPYHIDYQPRLADPELPKLKRAA